MTSSSLPHPCSPPDLDDKARRDLGWNDVLGLLASHCAGDVARGELLALRPFGTLGEARRRCALVRETLGLTLQGARLPVASVAPLDDALDRLRKRGPIGGDQLVAFERVFRGARLLREHLAHRRGETETLRADLVTPRALDAVEIALARKLDPDGSPVDAASPELARARSRASDTRRQLQVELNRLMRRYASALQGQYFDERDGRYVLPVRSDTEARPRGFVLDASASGSTLYIEPEELHELGNRLRLAEVEVLRIEAEILAELSMRVADVLPDAETAIASCVLADQLQAVASWAVLTHSVVVEPTEAPEISLVGARHPQLLAGAHDVVANDIAIRAEQVLVLSGPNAGGKTVNLKLLGLFAWMVRAGLPLPTDARSRVGWFDRVVTDIGDGQSLSTSLSTFSAHVTNVARCLDATHRGTLVLLDELAGGTDPDQGAALAVALLEEFRTRGAAVVVTTHYERLKALGGGTSDDYVNASVGFDPARMQPTFVLTMGVPGTSAAFDVAQRFGIDEGIVSRARALVPQEITRRQELTAQVEDERNRLRLARERAEAEAAELERKTAAVDRRLEALEKRQRAEVDRDVAALRQEVKVARDKLRDATRVISRGRKNADLEQAEGWINDVARDVAIGGKLARLAPPSDARPSSPSPSSPPAPGSKVWIRSLGALGEVVSVVEKGKQKGKLQVQLGVMKLTVGLQDVELRAGGSPPRRGSRPRNAREESTLELRSSAPLRHPGNSLELIGLRVEPALERLDVFVDQLLRGNERVGFVVHGHGTGALRSAVRGHLSEHSAIRRVEAAGPDEGGDALTVFTFDD